MLAGVANLDDHHRAGRTNLAPMVDVHVPCPEALFLATIARRPKVGTLGKMLYAAEMTLNRLLISVMAALFTRCSSPTDTTARPPSQPIFGSTVSE